MNNNQPKPLQPGDRPVTPGKPNPTCPIFLEARRVLDHSTGLVEAIRHLRRSTQRCLTCPQRQACPTLGYYRHAIEGEIKELYREWGFDRE